MNEKEHKEWETLLSGKRNLTGLIWLFNLYLKFNNGSITCSGQLGTE